MGKRTHVPKPVQWLEGLLLYPQHFQQTRRYWQQIINESAQRANPYFWGVNYCVFDQTDLSAFIVRVAELQAMMPDGTFVEVSEKEPLTLDLERKKDVLSKPLKIHLCVPKEHDTSANPKDEMPRYNIVDGDQHYHVDENTGDNPVLLPKMQPALMLLAGDTVPIRYTSLPLCEVVVRDGVLMMTSFHYPTPTLTPELVNVLQKEIQEIRRYCVYFVERLQSPLAFEGNALLDRYRKFYEALVTTLPSLEALVQNEGTHPCAMYQELCRTLGFLMCLGSAQMPPRVRAYDHANIQQSLQDVLQLIHERVNSLEKPAFTIPFSLDSGVFFLKLEERWLKDGFFVLSVHPDCAQDEAAVKSWVEGALMISKSQVPQSQMKRVLGAKREIIDQEDSLGLVYIPGRILVRVDVDPSCVEEGEEFCMVNLSRVHTPPHNVYLCVRD